MLEWSNDEDLQTLFSKCEIECGSKDFATLIISEFEQTLDAPSFMQEKVYEVICNFFPNEEYRQKTDNVRLFSLDPETRFKSADRAVVAYPIEYIITTMNQGVAPFKDIFIVSGLGDARTIVRRQISKKRAKKMKELRSVRELLLRGFKLRSVHMDQFHPYRTTTLELFNEKRGIAKKRQEVAEAFTTKIDLDGVLDEQAVATTE